MIGDATLTRLVRGKEIVLNARRQGGDCLVSVTGGDAPHIGAAALCADGEIRRLDRNGHREGELAAELAERVSAELTIPTIGIGAGGGCDGQVLVIHDMLGINKGFSPRFLRRYADLYTVMSDAVSQYIADVKSCDFPNEQEQY